MLRLSNLSMQLDETLADLPKKAAKALGIAPSEIAEVTLARQSVDARNKSSVRYIVTLDVTLTEDAREGKVMERSRHKQIKVHAPQAYEFPQIAQMPKAPIIVGLGPAGLFSALTLARNGVPCKIIERGRDVDSRNADVEKFWSTGVLDTLSNVQFGEGGAGTFSDGKLTTGTHDPRMSEVFRSFVAAGAPEDILYSHKPHIGTDILRNILKTMRAELLSLGCEICFEHKLVGLEHQGDRLCGIMVETPRGRESLPCSHLVLAIGHSARDTFTMLHQSNIIMEQKSFAIGVRIEHLQAEISRAQYGESYQKLPPSDYKLACHLPSGRSVFSFCACPGGVVVAASSAEGHLVSNGMSYRARDGVNINSGLLVGVGTEDFASHGGNHPLAGMYFQEHWEKIAYTVGGGGFVAPTQRVGDFLSERRSTSGGGVTPTYKPEVKWGDVREGLPPEVSQALAQAIPVFDRKVKGFANPDAVLTGIETRSSSPVRITRDQSLQATLRGVFPCGEGAGYAGGIVSAAVDGMRVAEAVVQST